MCHNVKLHLFSNTEACWALTDKMKWSNKAEEGVILFCLIALNYINYIADTYMCTVYVSTIH